MHIQKAVGGQSATCLLEFSIIFSSANRDLFLAETSKKNATLWYRQLMITMICKQYAVYKIYRLHVTMCQYRKICFMLQKDKAKFNEVLRVYRLIDPAYLRIFENNSIITNSPQITGNGKLV